MSRIIVKNLPSTVTEKKLREIFSEKGFVTDLQLKYNKAGVFRKFAFVGYKTEEEAQAAKEYFNNTFIFTSKIQVENCSNLNDPNKPKPWKEFLKEKSQAKEVSKDSVEEENKDDKKKKRTSKSKEDDIPDELKKDSRFKEFLAVHEDRKSKPLWADGIVDTVNEDGLDLSNDDGYDTAPKAAESEESFSEAKHQNKEKHGKKANKKPNESKLPSSKKAKIYNDSYTVKVRNLPYSCKKKQLKELFNPLKIVSLRLPPKNKGFAYVSFKTEKDMNIALNKHRGYLGGHRIDVIKYIRKENVTEQNKYQKGEGDMAKDMELLAETGRIYVRNLCYSVEESDLQELFAKYGPLAEIYLPVDLLTKKAQGFAFISYVFAEHAVKALTELDGTIFQGRLLHLIPAQPKKEIVTEENETNYKKKKEKQMKALSGSSHNWNILFLNMNAVADVIAEKYNVQKSALLNGDSKESVAVRMALAETQVVAETRKFLIDKGVELDAFSQPAAERSKTVIVVKNLPAKTSSEELHEIFSKHGTIKDIIMPPSGMVALIEFQDPTEAKLAFKKLAYSQFHHLPLYLEWAPINAIKETPSSTNDTNGNYIKESAGKEDTEQSPIDDSNQEEEEPSGGTTIFVKNINFCTTQERFNKHFEKSGPIHYAAISTKKDIKTGKMLSMGFGFVQYKDRASAMKAVQNLQLSKLDSHALELKFANRATLPTALTKRKKYEIKKQDTTKILVRNIPFEASEKEITELFQEFGTLKFIRLPRKMGSSGEHRGFGFVEYMTKTEAKRAFETLCHSTHLFGRRLVLEWANPKAEDVDEIRKKTARDFADSGPKKKLKKSKLREDTALAFARSKKEE